jgi:hypothetical protein
MNDAERKVIQQKQLKESNKAFEEIFDKLKHLFIYHNKIDNYLNDITTIDKIGDYRYYSKYDTDAISLIKNFFRGQIDNLLKSIHKDKQKCYYVVKRTKYQTALILFIGSEEECFNKAVTQKALYYHNIPHVVNNKIYGEVNKKIIMDIMINYDRIYGKILLDIFNKNI